MGALDEAICDENVTIDEREVEIPDMVEKKSVTKDTLWNCGECSFTSTNIVQSREHAVQHTGVYLHQCELCSRFFKTKGSLLRHQCVQKVSNDGSKSLGEVKLIDDLSLRKYELDTFETNAFEEDFHVNDMDEYEVKVLSFMVKENGHWACKSCEYRSIKKAHTKYHVQKHIEGFSHTCKTCEKVFKMRYSLRKHKCKLEYGYK